MCESNSLLNGSTDLQELLMSDYIDDFMATINNDLPTVQSSNLTLSDFENQIQAILSDNQNAMNLSSPQSSDLSLNNFQIPSSDILPLDPPKSSFLFLPNSTSFDNIGPEPLKFSPTSKPSSQPIFSPETFLYTPNTTNFNNIYSSEPLFYSPNSSEISNDDINSLDTLSPFQDLNVSPTNSALADFGSYSSMDDKFDTFDTLLSPESNPDYTTIHSENGKKRVSVEYDSMSSDESSNKKRKSTNGTNKFVKRTNSNKDINFESTASNISLKSPGVNMNTVNAILASLSDSEKKSIDSINKLSDNSKLPISRLKSSTTPSEPNSKPQSNKQQKKVAHNVIERRYRNNINDRINDLKNVIPALCHLKSKDDDVIEEVDGIPAATKTNKATILRKATEYIVYLKKSNQNFKIENEVLKKIITTFPGGIETYDACLMKINKTKMETPPDTPPSGFDHYDVSDHDQRQQDQFNSPPPSGNAGSRLLMSLFMCMTFFTDPSRYVQSVSHHHHDEGRVITSNNSTESVVSDEIYNSQDGMTIDVWYLARIITFLMCFTYIVWPSLFSIKLQQTRKSTIKSILNSKKNATDLYSSLSKLAETSSMNTFGFVIGLFIELLKLFLRRFLGWEISYVHDNVNMDERLLEIELWCRLGEVELCGGNKRATRLSVLYTCFKTVNLLESSFIYKDNMHISPSRIFANAALQCHIGLSYIPFLPRRIVSHFWKLAVKEKGNFTSENRWLEIAIISDQNSDMLEVVANRISDLALHLLKDEKTFKINTTIPLIYVSEVQVLFHIKQAFSNFISERHGVNRIQEKCKFTFSELLSFTAPASLMRWYTLVGCAVQAFSEGKNDLGTRLVGKLKEESKNDNNPNKQVIIMGLLSRSYLIYDKVEASIHYANKAIDYVTLRKNDKMEVSNVNEDLEIKEIVKDVHDLAEFCVGWIVLETRVVGLKCVENLLSRIEYKKLPDVLDEKHLKSSIEGWARYLRRSSRSSVFNNISKSREIFIKKLDVLGRIISGIDEDNDSGCDCGDSKQSNHKAIKVLRVLKGM